MSSASVEDVDSGLACLVLLLRFLGIPADAEQLRHRLGGAACGVTEILRCAKELGLKARVVAKNWPQLEKAALPAIAENRDGSFRSVRRDERDCHSSMAKLLCLSFGKKRGEAIRA